MAEYKGRPVTAPMVPNEAYAKLTDISSLQRLIGQMPEEVRSKMGDVTFTDDEIIIGTPQMGNITMKVVEREAPRLVKYAAEQSPVPLSLSIVVAPGAEESTSDVSAVIDAEIPAMLRPLVGPKLQEAADKFGDLLRLILSL